MAVTTWAFEGVSHGAVLTAYENGKEAHQNSKSYGSRRRR